LSWLNAKHSSTIFILVDRGLATGLHVQQLQKLLQTYFGAMRQTISPPNEESPRYMTYRITGEKENHWFEGL
jgi:hypothetical protein